MVITPDFVFLHLGKTGGTFVTARLKRVYASHLPPRQTRFVRRLLVARPEVLESRVVLKTTIRMLGWLSLRKHGSVREIPGGASAAPVLSIARNPFDRFVSLYYAGWWRDKASPSWVEAVKARFPHFPDLSFAEFLELSPHFGVRLSEAFLAEPPATGFLTRNFAYFYCRGVALEDESQQDELTASQIRQSMVKCRFLHMEQLNGELADFLNSLGHPRKVVDTVRAADKILPKTPRRPEGSWQAYYSPAMVEDVLRRERTLFELFPEYLPGS